MGNLVIMDKIFRITKRHYNIIIKQVLDNLPQEAGGFLGGKDFTIQAILPMFNQHLANKTDTFAFTPEDVDRAHRFFQKHGLTYYGLYHSHPSGIAEPSEQDIKTGHKYHFIIGATDEKTVNFRAFEIQGRKVIPVPIQIITDNNFTAIDIHQQPKDPKKQLKAAQRTMFDDAADLGAIIDDIRHERKIKYPKMDPKNKFDSDFSTLA